MDIGLMISGRALIPLQSHAIHIRNNPRLALLPSIMITRQISEWETSSSRISYSHWVWKNAGLWVMVQILHTIFSMI
jgi:hypothetical protein